MPHTTVAQNQRHRQDIAWTRHKSSTFRFETPGRHVETFTSEHHNVFTGQVIRKSWRMTGRDWWVFAADGSLVGRAHSLTFAKAMTEEGA